MYVCMYVCMNVCRGRYVCVCCMYTHIMYACMYVCMYECMYVCMYVLYVCTDYVCMYVCVACIYMLSVCIHAHSLRFSMCAHITRPHAYKPIYDI